MYATLIVVAALWGAATGVLLPRAAYRFSVEPGDPWRDSCPAGHPFTGPVRGWLGVARCTECAAAEPPHGAARAPGSTGGNPVGSPGADNKVPGADNKGPGADTGTPADDSGAVAVPAVSSTGTGTGTGTRIGSDAGAGTDTATVPPDRSDAPAVPAATEPGTGPAAPPGPRPERESGPGAAVRRDTSPGPSGAPDASRVRYRASLLVPLLSALGCVALTATTGARPELAVWLLLTPFAVLLALVDRNVHRLPDQLTLPLAAAAAVLLGLAALAPGEDTGSWRTALLGGLALGACYFVLFLINPNGMGFGDVKLALSLGVVLGWYGWPVLFVGAFAGFLLGSLYGVGLMLLRRASRKSAIPFGPFMIVGALLGLVLGGLAAS